MPLTYTQYVASLENLLVIPAGDANLATDLPNIIDDAELRIYRELDLLDTSVRATAALTAGNRNFTLPSSAGTFVVVSELNVVTPSTTTAPDSGTRNPLLPASNEMLNSLWPSVAGSTVPQYFAMVNQQLAIVGPWPAAAYTVEVVGSIRPASLSSSNVTTLLSTYWPDLLIAASMVRAAGYQKNYGQGVDDPKMAITWESHFQELLKGADIEEMRKKFTSEGWSSDDPAKIATPART